MKEVRMDAERSCEAVTARFQLTPQGAPQLGSFFREPAPTGAEKTGPFLLLPWPLLEWELPRESGCDTARMAFFCRGRYPQKAGGWGLVTGVCSCSKCPSVLKGNGVVLTKLHLCPGPSACLSLSQSQTWHQSCFSLTPLSRICYHSKTTHNRKFTVLTIFKCTFSIVKYIHSTVQPISRTFSSCKTHSVASHEITPPSSSSPDPENSTAIWLSVSRNVTILSTLHKSLLRLAYFT